MVLQLVTLLGAELISQATEPSSQRTEHYLVRIVLRVIRSKWTFITSNM